MGEKSGGRESKKDVTERGREMGVETDKEGERERRTGVKSRNLPSYCARERTPQQEHNHCRPTFIYSLLLSVCIETVAL